MRSRTAAPFVALLALLAQPSLRAETGYEAWLRYVPVQGLALTDTYRSLPATVAKLDNSPVVGAAQSELIRGIRGLLGHTLRSSNSPVTEDMFLLGTLESVKRAFPRLSPPADLIRDGYWLKTVTIESRNILLIAAANDRGVLYGNFACSAISLSTSLSIDSTRKAIHTRQYGG